MINYTRTQPAPPCLVQTRKYDCEGVLQQLRIDFKNKCYLCEQKAPTSINVEHFKPHKGDENLKLDWNNLFYACGHCNNCKLAEFDDILDCTNSTIWIVDAIRFEIKPFPKEKAQIKAIFTDISTKNTTVLLEKIYNGEHTVNKTFASENLREALLKEIKEFGRALENYFDETSSDIEKQKAKRNIQKRLSAESAFTAFKIWIIKENTHLLNEFQHFLPQKS
jgi:hypothetical protein